MGKRNKPESGKVRIAMPLKVLFATGVTHNLETSGQTPVAKFKKSDFDKLFKLDFEGLSG